MQAIQPNYFSIIYNKKKPVAFYLAMATPYPEHSYGLASISFIGKIEFCNLTIFAAYRHSIRPLAGISAVLGEILIANFIPSQRQFNFP
jgi:hypothetical protein